MLVRAAERLGYQVFVALLTHFQSGSPDYSTISYPRSQSRYRRFDGGWDDDISGENDDDCRTFAAEIIGRWKRRARWSYPRPSQEALPSRMLILLDRIGTIDLAARFVSEILPDDSDGDEGPALARLGSRHGWEPLREPLLQYFAKQVPSEYRSNPPPPVKAFEGLCCSPPDMTDERRALGLALADEVERMIERFDARNVQPRRSEESRTEIVKSIFRALTALSDDEHLERFIEHLRATPIRYGLRDVLIPAMKSIRAEVGSVSLDGRSFEQLLRHCLAELRNPTATRIAPPADWSREASITCPCADCRELARFLHDPSEQVYRFRRLKKIRDHWAVKSKRIASI